TRFHHENTKPELSTNVSCATPLLRQGATDEHADADVFQASDAAAVKTRAQQDGNRGTKLNRHHTRHQPKPPRT
ncbi:hypothetical protein AAGG49_22675, partial [Stenotrophomonas maltophilia]